MKFWRISKDIMEDFYEDGNYQVKVPHESFEKFKKYAEEIYEKSKEHFGIFYP